MKRAPLIVLALATAALAAPVLSPAAVEASIRAKGARRTVDDLVRAGRWEFVTDAMNRGTAAWIALAPRLAPGSDAGNAEDLGLSLAFALPRNPRAVLAALDPANGHILGVGRVCGLPFIEDTEPRNYLADVRAALDGVRDQHLQRAKIMCLRALDAASGK